MLMKKLSEEHYIICDDSEIKTGDWYYDSNDVESLIPIYQRSQQFADYSGCKKITHSTQPLEWFGGEIIFLSEVKELLGVVDVEKKGEKKYPKSEFWVGSGPSRLYDENAKERRTYIEGYNQALEDNKDKKYTEDDLKKAICIAKDSMGVDNDGETCYSHLSTEQIIQSLQPTEWEVEFVDGKLKLKQ